MERASTTTARTSPFRSSRPKIAFDTDAPITPGLPCYSPGTSAAARLCRPALACSSSCKDVETGHGVDMDLVCGQHGKKKPLLSAPTHARPRPSNLKHCPQT